MKAIRIHAPGGAEVLSYEDVPDPALAPGRALVRVEAVGVNFADIGNRRNANVSQGPVGIGGEAAGTVLEVASGVTGVKPGDRVVWRGVVGSYAEMVSAPVENLVPIPDNVTTKQAAGVLVQGLTAHYLAYSAYPLKPDDTCLVQAAAGGVGLLLCQVARMRGANVIGTASTPEKARFAREAGAQSTIIYSDVDFEDAVMRITANQGVDVVYDAVGLTTFVKGFNCLRPRGMMVSYGAASGPIPPLDTSVLRGSLYLTRTSLASYTTTREEVMERAGDVFEWIGAGKLNIHVHSEYPLREASKAHEALENRETVGKVLLIP